MADSRNYSIKQLTKIQLKVARQSRTIMFLFSAVTSILLVLLLRDPLFTPTQDYVLFLLFFSIGLWITEAIPPFAVGILIVGFLVFTMGQENTMDAKRYVQTWSDGVIWLFLGGFFLAEGMKKTKLDFLLLKIAAPKFGSQAQYIILGLMMTTAVISMLMSNTATTAMMIATVTPLFTQLGKDSNISKVLVLGIPTAAAIGGMGTIIGSAPNAIAVGALEGIGIKITFIEWMIIGVPVAFLLLFMFWKILLVKYKIKKETLSLDFLQQEIPQDEEYTEEDKIRKRIVLIVLISTLSLWLTSQWTGIPVAAVSGIPIVALTMLGIIDADDVRSLPWDTLMLVAGGLALGLAIQEQGLADYFISKISSVDINFYLLLFIFSITTVTLSNFMSNTAATTILIPVAISLMSITKGVDPMVLPFVIGLSASCALLLPVSTPPNAIAYSTGLIEQKEFRIGGIFIGLVGPILIISWTLLYALIT
ncbi:MAG TPA: DASS family sodium-coupled anion symporter [Flavobacterium sp.]|uniref:SLC13 family permease n=3 Tax=Flavobacterium TaxID=237 RepID=UPI0025BD8280|nr:MULTISPECIES: DASS family sodium-coupled anion symporter [unclassified Flavobacterium]HRE76864.1 DASS family sodium-coupled anion symporter [Flavobacterium sp.]